MRYLDILIGNWLADLFEKFATAFQDGAYNLRRCRRCGENVFYGKSCDEVLPKKFSVDRTSLNRQENALLDYLSGE